jgi:hypothetical protein
MADDIYIGNCKTINFDNGGSLLKGSICLSDIPEEHIFEAQNGKRYLSIDIGKKKGGADQYGKTHWVKINIYNQKKKEDDTPDSIIPF